MTRVLRRQAVLSRRRRRSPIRASIARLQLQLALPLPPHVYSPRIRYPVSKRTARCAVGRLQNKAHNRRFPRCGSAKKCRQVGFVKNNIHHPTKNERQLPFAHTSAYTRLGCGFSADRVFQVSVSLPLSGTAALFATKLYQVFSNHCLRTSSTTVFQKTGPPIRAAIQEAFSFRSTSQRGSPKIPSQAGQEFTQFIFALPQISLEIMRNTNFVQGQYRLSVVFLAAHSRQHCACSMILGPPANPRS